MVNFNGEIVAADSNSLVGNRAFLFGDGVFETVKVLDNKVLFLEDHYFRLMASMRIVRMEIPMNFTMEFFESQLLSLVQSNAQQVSARARITVYRNGGGFYLPQTNSVSFLIQSTALENQLYKIDKIPYEVELYKDFYVTKQLLSSVKSTNKMLNITGSIFASENGYDNCLILNDSKNVIEGLQENIFMLHGDKLVTPPVSEGCHNGVMRKQILALARKFEHVEVSEEIISPFDLQKADELFLTNVIKGIQPITRYRKKEYRTELSEQLLQRLNAQIRLG